MYVSFKWRRCWWDGCTTDLLWSVPIPQTAWYPCFDGNSCIRWSYSFIFQWFLLCIGPKCCCFNPHFCLDQTFPDFGLHQGAMVLTCFDPPVSAGYTAKVREERHANSSKRIRPCFGDRVGHDYWPSLRGGMEHTRIPNCWSNKGLILLEFVGFSYVLKKLLLYRCSLCGGVIKSFMCFHVCLLHSRPVLQYSIFGWILDPNRLLAFLSLRRLDLGINWYIYVPHSVIGW